MPRVTRTSRSARPLLKVAGQSMAAACDAPGAKPNKARPIAAICMRIGPKPCQLFAGDMRVVLKPTERYTAREFDRMEFVYTGVATDKVVWRARRSINLIATVHRNLPIHS